MVLCAIGLLGMRRGPDLWFTWHDSGAVLEGGTRIRRSLYRWAIRRCQRIFGSSDRVAGLLSERLGGREVQTFRNGVPVAPETNGRLADPPLIAWAARLVPSKDPLILLRSLRTLKAEGLHFRLVMAGDPQPHQAAYRRVVEEEVDRLGLRAEVVLPGWIADPHELFGKSAIGVQSSLTEGLSMTLLEQMMAGLAIVATDVGDTRVALDGGACGRLVTPQDETSLTAALRDLLSKPALRESLGTAARKRALASFTLEAMVDQVSAWSGCSKDQSQLL